MASLVTEKQPKIGEVWRNTEDQTDFVNKAPEYVYITSFTQDFIFYKEYFTNNTIFYKEEYYDYNWFVKEYKFHDKPKMKPTQVMSRNNDVVKNMDITDLISDDDFNLSDFNLSDVDSDNGSDNGRPSLGDLDLYTVGSLVEPLGEQPKKKATTKKKRTSKKRPTSQRQPKRPRNKLTSINWNDLSKNYDTLFYPKHNGKVVPQVMTIADVKQKETKRASAKEPKIVYIFQVKHNNKNIDEEIKRWSNWRRDYNSVNSWVQQIGRMIKNCEKDSQRNFLKALQRSFTITKRRFRKNKDKNDSFKQEMAICYVHFIKDRRTNDHTWPTFETYLKTNCERLNVIFNTIKKEKETKNRNDKKKVPTNRTTKFASNAFHDYLEYVHDLFFKVLSPKEEEEAKTELAEMFGIAMPRSTAEGMGKAVTLLMAKLKF